jgi:hypothetical protein
LQQHFNHLGPAKIYNLDQLTTWSLPMQVLTKVEIHKGWILTKMTNRILKQLNIYKSMYLEIIYLDIADLFPKLIHSKHYFILIIDCYTRVNWIILHKHASDAIPPLKIWKVEVNLATGDKNSTTRTDKAPEPIQPIWE